MKSYRKELWLNLPTRRGFVNITPEVEIALRESGIKEGMALVNVSLSHLHHQIYHDLSELLAVFVSPQKSLQPDN